MGKYWLLKQFYKVPAIRPYIPDAAICAPKTLQRFLEKYQMVYIKPDNGRRGHGVIRAWKTGNQYAYIVVRGNPVYCSSVSELYNRMRLAKKKTRMIQQGIHLAKIGDRIIDIRVMMIRDTDLNWQYAGMVAKVSGEKSIISNVNLGEGYVLKVEEALRQSLGIDDEELNRIIAEMIELCHQCNHLYSGKGYDWRIGYDIGVDESGKIWLIEANRMPSHSLFRKLEDKTMYRKINRMWSRYRKEVQGRK